MADLFVTYRGMVYPWQCDHVGHLNVTHYVGKFDEATWQMFNRIGVTPAYMRENMRGVAAVRQNITYRRELRPGDLVTIRTGLLDIRGQVIRFYHEMINDETGEIAATTVISGVQIDTQTRKYCPFPEAVIQDAKGLIVDISPII